MIAAICAVIATAIGIVISFLIHWFPAQASTQAKNTDRLYHVLVIASIPIFVLVVTVILYSVWQFRMRPGEELKDGPPIHGNTRLEVFWTAIPTVLLLGPRGLLVRGAQRKREETGERDPDRGLRGTVRVELPIPEGRHRRHALKSTELYVPKGESVEFNIHAKDVIHAFWVPAFRIQEDAVPGITTHWRATPDRLGTYPVVCNLLCGLGHSLMRSTIHVVTPQRFQAWVASQAGAAGAGGSSTATAGSSG